MMTGIDPNVDIRNEDTLDVGFDSKMDPMPTAQYLCFRCPFVCKWRTSLVRHLGLKHGEAKNGEPVKVQSYKCTMSHCAAVFKLHSSLMRHLRRNHDIASEKPPTTRSILKIEQEAKLPEKTLEQDGAAPPEPVFSFSSLSGLGRRTANKPQVVDAVQIPGATKSTANKPQIVDAAQIPGATKSTANKPQVVDAVQIPGATKSSLQPRRYSPRTNWCTVCGKCYASAEKLRRHARVAHEGVAKKTRNLRQGAYSCPVCEGRFSTRQSLRAHVARKHSDVVIPSDDGGALTHAKSANSSVSCPVCHENLQSVDRKLTNMSGLVQHLNASHGHNIQVERLSFETEDKFARWLADVERNTPCRFSRTRSDCRNGKAVKRHFYHCSRSGQARMLANGLARKRQTKGRGSVKIGDTCPAHFVLHKSITDGSCFVKYVATHLCHTNPFQHLVQLFLTKDDRRWIAEKLSLKIPVAEIIGEARVATDPRLSRRLGIITRKDVWNVARDFKLDRPDPGQPKKRSTKSFVRKKEAARDVLSEFQLVVERSVEEEEVAVILEGLEATKAKLAEIRTRRAAELGPNSAADARVATQCAVQQAPQKFGFADGGNGKATGSKFGIVDGSNGKAMGSKFGVVDGSNSKAIGSKSVVKCNVQAVYEEAGRSDRGFLMQLFDHNQ